MDPERQRLLNDINLAINNSDENSSLIQSLNDLSLKVRDPNNDINSLTMEFKTLTPSEGGRRHRGSKKAHKGKRHGNASLRAWVTFVKKVQKEEGIGYKEAMSVAKRRKDKGEKWRGGDGESVDPNVDPNVDKYDTDTTDMSVGGRRRRRSRRSRGSKKRSSRRHRRSRRHH
jgi:hypothetical protein